MENSNKNTKNPWYDTKEGIETSLSSLRDLNKLIKTRHKAGYKHNETLNKVFILGHFCLQETGSCDLVRIQVNEEGVIIPSNLLSQAELETYLKESKRSTSDLIYQNAFLPSPEEECFFCRKTWNIGNCHNVIRVSSDLCHPACYAKHLEKVGRLIYKEIFHNTDFEIEKMVAIPKVLPDLTPLAPWFMAHTQFGKITIGWQDYCQVLDEEICYEIDVTDLSLSDRINGTKLYIQSAPIRTKDNDKKIIEATSSKDAQEILSIVFSAI